MKINNRAKLIIGLSLLASTSVYSTNIINTQTKNTISHNSEIDTTQQSVSYSWGLTLIEWNQYVKLMQGESGHYYKQLSPPEVLGINADTQEEMRHFAELSAQQEHDKLERELRFNTAFHDAAARLYSSEQLIKPFNIRPFTPIQMN